MRFVVLLAIAVLFVAGSWWWPVGGDLPVPGTLQPRSGPGSGAVPVPGHDLGHGLAGDSTTTPAHHTATSAPATRQRIDPPTAPSPGLVFAVVDPDGVPVPGAPIEVEWRDAAAANGPPKLERGVTDRDGRFAPTCTRIEVVQDVRVTLPRLGQTSSGSGLQASFADPATVVLMAPAVADLVVRCVDQGGRPVAGAYYQIDCVPTLGPPRHRPLRVVEHRGRTDDAGEARFAVPAGHALLQVGATGYLRDARWQCEFAPGEHQVVCELQSLAGWRIVPVTVEVVPGLAGFLHLRAQYDLLPSLREQPGVLERVSEPVELGSPAAPYDPGRRPNYYFPEHDRERLRERVFPLFVPPTPWRLTLAMEESAVVERAVDPTESAVRVQVVPGGPESVFRVRGRVLLPDGAPAVDLQLRWLPLQGLDFDMAGVRTREDGRFEFIRPAGTAGALEVDSMAYAAQFLGPWQGTEGTVDVELRLQPPAAIQVRFLDAQGRSVAGSLQLFGFKQPDGGPWERFVEATPEATLLQMPAGRYELWATPRRGGWPARRWVTTGESITVIQGEGLDEVARVAVWFVDAETRQPLAGVRAADRESDDRGFLGIAQPPGLCEFECSLPGYTTRIVRWPSLAAGWQERIVALAREQERFVQVVDERGRGMHGALVLLVDPERPARADWLEVGYVDAAGRADLQGLPQGRLQLVVRRKVVRNGGLLDTGEHREFELPAGAGVTATAVLRWSEGRPR